MIIKLPFGRLIVKYQKRVPTPPQPKARWIEHVVIYNYKAKTKQQIESSLNLAISNTKFSLPPEAVYVNADCWYWQDQMLCKLFFEAY